MMMAASQMAPVANIFLIHAIGPCERLATAAISARYFEKNAMTAPSGASQGVTRKIHPCRSALKHGPTLCREIGKQLPVTLGVFNVLNASL